VAMVFIGSLDAAVDFRHSWRETHGPGAAALQIYYLA